MAARTRAWRWDTVSSGAGAGARAEAISPARASNVAIEPPRVGASAESSRSNAVTSPAVGTTSTGSRSSAARNRPRIASERPELGGPTMSSMDTV